MTSDEKLIEAENDISELITRVQPALRILKRVVDDQRNWQKDMTSEILARLRDAVEHAQDHQIIRLRR